MAVRVAVLLACRVVVSPCCRRACVVTPASGVRRAWLKGGHTYLDSLDSDDGMRRHRLDDVAHLPRRLHHPSRDVALPRCCCSWLCVSWVLLRLLMAGEGDGRWRQWWRGGSGGRRRWWLA